MRRLELPTERDSRATTRNKISLMTTTAINTSSVNGFWASIGPATPHTAYSAAKFAVKGFTEALITDLSILGKTIPSVLLQRGAS